MKKLHWVGTVATILISVSAITGCSGDDPVPANMNAAGQGTGGSGTGGSGPSGGAAGSGTAGGTQLIPPATYVVFSGADAAPGAAAPAAWGSTGAGCTACHQANGEGFTGLAPEVRHVPAEYATWVVRNGLMFGGQPTGMTKFPATSADPKVIPISDADLAAVIAWLNAMPRPTTGQALYKDFCGNCHGPVTPSGGAVPVSIQGKTRAEVTMKVRMGEGTDPTMRNLYMPKHSATDLTDAELGLIMDFIGAK